MWRRGCKPLLLLLALASSWAAQAATPQDEARSLYELAKKEFAEGRLEPAAEDFRRAYALWPTPELLLNLGQCSRALGRRGEAVDYFQRFLSTAPLEHPLRSAVTVTLKELEEAARSDVPLETVSPGPRDLALSPPTASPAAPDPALTSTPAAPRSRGHESGGLLSQGTTWIWIAAGAVVTGAALTTYALTRPMDAPLIGTLKLPPP
jgi:hypothetical protein